VNFTALAQAAEGGGSSQLMSFIPIILIFVIFYFLLIRPQQKKEKDRKKMISEIQKNDKIVTVGGIHGIVLSVNEASDTLVIKSADSTKLEMAKSSVQNKIVPQQPKKEESKPASKKK
jgi:preprotein translocase subunit YajC